MKLKPVYYITALLLAIIIFAANFLSTDLFAVGLPSFSVWFVLSIFAFTCGWLINKTLGYNHGGKVVFAVIISAIFLSIVVISLFSDYFGFSNFLVENIILYILRNISLGATALFGMAVAEVIYLQKKIEVEKRNYENEDNLFSENAKRQADLIIEEAKLKAAGIIFEAEKNAQETIFNKQKIEQQIKEFIRTEKELINKYQADEKQDIQ
jgi:fructose-specific phosphotransferase system component IIB